jgi:predicted nucleic acid-binding protein
MIYIDTSSFLKLFLIEDFSQETTEKVFWESAVIVSSLTILEARIQIRGLQLGGVLRAGVAGQAVVQMFSHLEKPPFKVQPVTEMAVQRGLVRCETSQVHCRALDRLHLAILEERGITRLMTHDTRQAAAARELGYEVISPGLG